LSVQLKSICSAETAFAARFVGDDSALADNVVAVALAAYAERPMPLIARMR
jgi:hypothetical protein